MLTIGDTTRHGRRDFLRVGGLAGGALALPGLLPNLLRAGAPLTGANRPVTDKSVIFLFLHGGPSQIETFDPKMTAPAEVRSATGATQTAIPGVSFGSSFPELARRADGFTVVRSFTTGDGNHDIKPVVGRDTFGANLGSAYAAVAGGVNPDTAMPSNVLLFPKAVDPDAGPGPANFGRFNANGPFGAGAIPFQPDGDGGLRADMRVNLPLARLDDRRSLLAAFDAARVAGDEAGGVDSTRERAFTVLRSGIGDAFDLTKEDPRTLARYDTAPRVNALAINTKWNNHKHYTDNARTLGRLLLLARRLCERGAGFVTVTTNFVWDMHADVNNAPMVEGMSYMAPPLDHALSAFLDDVRARGLDDKILLVACGEMGRTPKINRNGGRDHWGGLAPLLLAGGGGLRMGQVIGQSDREAGTPATQPVRIPHLLGTVMHTLFDVGRLRVTPRVGREVLQLADHEPIPGLHG